jgi:stage III sporulation protein AE
LTLECASAEVSLPEKEWEDLQDAIPPEVADRLPEGVLDGKDGFFAGVEEMSRGEYIIAVISDVLGVSLGESSRMLLALLCALAIAAIMHNLGRSIDGAGLSPALRICSVGAIASAVLYTFYADIERLGELFEKLWVMLGAMIPVTSGIWAMGGNVTTAASGGAWFYVMLNVCQTVIAGSVIPVCAVIATLAICDSASEEVKVGRVLAAVKRIYNFLLGFLMTLLLALLSAQTTLCASADTVSARSARLMSGTLIPIVGGSVGETLRTLAGGVSYLKDLFGIAGVLMIAMLVLPQALAFLLKRFVFLILAGIADMLGCSVEARLLEGFGEVYGTALGALSVVSVSFVLGLCIFMRTVVAVA